MDLPLNFVSSDIGLLIYFDSLQRELSINTAMAKILRQIISTASAPRTTAPYNQAIKVDNMVFLSGVLGINKSTNQLVDGSVEDETKQLLDNMGNILKAADSGFEKVIKTTILLNDIAYFQTVNEVYKQYFPNNFPARTTYAIGKLPLNARIEIEAIGLCGDVETVIIES